MFQKKILFKYTPDLKSRDEQRQISPQKGEKEVKADEWVVKEVQNEQILGRRSQDSDLDSQIKWWDIKAAYFHCFI